MLLKPTKSEIREHGLPGAYSWSSSRRAVRAAGLIAVNMRIEPTQDVTSSVGWICHTQVKLPTGLIMQTTVAKV
jgi:hypothetical protein